MVALAVGQAAPRFKPQLINSMMRLEHMLGRPLTHRWRKVQGYIVELGTQDPEAELVRVVEDRGMLGPASAVAQSGRASGTTRRAGLDEGSGW